MTKRLQVLLAAWCPFLRTFAPFDDKRREVRSWGYSGRVPNRQQTGNDDPFLTLAVLRCASLSGGKQTWRFLQTVPPTPHRPRHSNSRYTLNLQMVIWPLWAR